MRLQNWFYGGGRPNRAARVLDRLTAAVYGRGVSPDYLVTLEVRGRRSGHTIRLPLVMVVVEGERYLVAMLGQDSNWVSNVRATGGEAVLRHGRREEVRLIEIPVEDRAPVLETYLRRAPNARAPCRIRTRSIPIPRVPRRTATHDLISQVWGRSSERNGG